jgi:hypothetical protein
MEAIPPAVISAADCSHVLVFHWITRFGVPATITSDLSVSHHQTIAYYPYMNSAVERLHHRLKDALHAWVAAATGPKRSLEFSLAYDNIPGRTQSFLS